MVVHIGCLLLKEIGLVTVLRSGALDEIEQPSCRIRVALNVEVFVADHVENDKGFDALQRSVVRPFCGKMTAAIDAVRVRPLLEGFLAVEEDEPDAVSVERAVAEMIRHFDEQAS